MRSILILLCLGAATIARSLSPVIEILPRNETRFLGMDLEVFEDTSGMMDLAAVRNAKGFVQGNRTIYNFGLTRSAYWVRGEVVNRSDDPLIYAYVPHPELEDILAFVVHQNGSTERVAAGQKMDVGRLSFVDVDPVLPLSIRPGERVTFYLRVRSDKQLQLPLLLTTSLDLTMLRSTRDSIIGIYLGVMLVLLLYNLFVHLSIRDRSYLIYVVYLLAVAITQSTFLGLTKYYLWPSSAWLSVHASMIFTVVTAIAAGEFMRSFLQMPDHAPGMARILGWGYVPLIAGLAVRLLIDPLLGYNILQAAASCLALFQLYVAIHFVRRGSRPARFFLLAWCVFLLGIIVYVLKDFNVLPYTNLTKYTMPIGSAIEGVLLSFGLADKINILRREKEQSQAQALLVSQENERIIREQNVVLEHKVKERTQALQESNDHLKRTQTQLVNAEKMASLGQLTAGIAHEINNPVNFITSNLPPLRRNLGEMLDVLRRYRGLKQEMPDPRLQEIAEEEERLGIDESIDELKDILQSIEEGADRTASIVRGLRNFSRLDEDDLKEADLNEGIRSTLTVMGPQIRDNVTMELQLGDLPRMECHAGKLNQVFMNMLTNAVQAVRARHGDSGGQVAVSTSSDGERVLIVVRDNGVGMDASVRERIFEPFFTTKDVGEGTGLGLSIAYSIIEGHRGTIEVESEPGAGTEFRIILPVHQERPATKRATAA